MKKITHCKFKPWTTFSPSIFYTHLFISFYFGGIGPVLEYSQQLYVEQLVFLSTQAKTIIRICFWYIHQIDSTRRIVVVQNQTDLTTPPHTSHIQSANG